MILLDTHVMSEPLRHAPELRVIEWIDAQAMETLFLAAITDLACTQAYAALMAKARRAGSAVATADGYIAAIAATHEFAVATRDTGPFQAAGVAVINPWAKV
jgi:toxin FitB